MSIRRPRSARVVVRTVVVLAVIGAIATAAFAATGSHGTTYRTAVATRANVDAELHETGTIEPVDQATVAFPISGTVASVAVKAGQSVTTGQTLATLDTSSLLASLTKAEATLASTELTLDKVRNGEQVGGGASSGARGGSSSNDGAAAAAAATASAASAASATTSASASASGGSNTALQAAERAATQAEQKVQAALKAAQTAVEQTATACASTPPTTTSTTSTTSTTTPSGNACTLAEAFSLRALQNLATAEQNLSRAQQQLSTLLASSGSNGSSGSSGKTPSSTQATTPKSSDTTVTYTDAQIASYEMSVTAAAADVATAQQALAQATIVSPITGTVAAVSLITGASVSAASSTANVVVVGNGGYEIATSVTVADRAKLKVGDTATIVADGTSMPLAGRVVAIAVVETSGTSSSTYAVTIGFTDRPAGLRNGASAAVTIVTAHTTSAITVPTSAVHTNGTLHTVTVMTKGKPVTTVVQIGTVGATRTAITSGLNAGQVVSLADVGASIPSSNTSNNNGGGAFTNGLGGGTANIQRITR